LTGIYLFLVLPVHNLKTEHIVLDGTGLNGRGQHGQYHLQRIKRKP